MKRNGTGQRRTMTGMPAPRTAGAAGAEPGPVSVRRLGVVLIGLGVLAALALVLRGSVTEHAAAPAKKAAPSAKPAAPKPASTAPSELTLPLLFQENVGQ